MSISIATNVTSLIAQENLRINNEFQSRTIQRLTTGYRINASGDDAAGLAVANKFRSDIAELVQGVRNANDGISALQIIDGGLNNISKILDRLKTLATQSASTTFTGNRGVLNDEYQELLREISQQASNVGLVGGGVYNVVNRIYIGGGSNTENAQVTVDLSGPGNQVDAAGLGLAMTSIGAGGTPLTGNSVRLDAPGATFVAAAAQSFTFNLYHSSAAQTVTVSVGGSGALSAHEVVDSLNGSLSSYGIVASVGSDGQLTFGGSTPFTVSAGAGPADRIVTDSVTATNGGVYLTGGVAYTAGAAENLTFQNGDGSATVALTASETVDSAIAKINAATATLGIYAVKTADGLGISIQSPSRFTSSTDVAGGVFTASGAQTIASPDTSAVVIGNAQAAIQSINQAVANLGLVQGRVGTGQNKLQYAIQLAESQISSYSAAESRIRDADVAQEAANLTRAQVMQQASMAAMAQANSSPQAVLALLRQ